MAVATEKYTGGGDAGVGGYAGVGYGGILWPLTDTNSSDIAGNSRIERVNDTSLSGSAFVEYLKDTSITGRAFIEKQNSLDLLGNARLELINNLDLFGNAKIINPKPDKTPQKWTDNSSTMPSNWQKEVKKDTDWRRNYYD